MVDSRLADTGNRRVTPNQLSREEFAFSFFGPEALRKLSAISSTTAPIR